jgi:ATP-independent RNA helicase DbpA
MLYFASMDYYKKLLRELNYADWTFIQKESIRIFPDTQEIVLYSPTGSGKTLAFLIPIIHQMLLNEKQGLQTLILTPTRELTIQIEQVFKSLKSGFLATSCYGGHSMKTEVKNLSAFPAVIIGTPGRIADHLRRGNIDLEQVNYFVVDEFDKCLEIGFLKEIEEIYTECNHLKKKVFCSATRIDEFPAFIQFKKPSYIDVLAEVDEPLITFYSVKDNHNRLGKMKEMIQHFHLEPTIIFSNFRDDVSGLFDYFDGEEIAVTAYHGGMEQDERERSLIKFRNGSAPVLICTDLGARGLDIPKIKHIIHYQLPEKEDAFIHRNGRTARMSEDGSVYVFEEDVQTANYELPVLSEKTFGGSKRYVAPEWTTVYFSAGKKDKINKIDLVGFICQKGNVDKSKVGIITVLDNSSYVAIQSYLLPELLPELRQHKVKGQKLRISVSR